MRRLWVSPPRKKGNNHCSHSHFKQSRSYASDAHSREVGGQKHRWTVFAYCSGAGHEIALQNSHENVNFEVCAVLWEEQVGNDDTLAASIKYQHVLWLPRAQVDLFTAWGSSSASLRIAWEAFLLGKNNTAGACEVFIKYSKRTNFVSDWVSLWWIDYSRLYSINPHDLCVHCHSKWIIIPS